MALENQLHEGMNMPFLNKQFMTAVAVFTTAGVVFGTAGPALAEDSTDAIQDSPEAAIESILMEGVDPETQRMSEEELLATASQPETKTNPARDLILEHVDALDGDNSQGLRTLGNELQELVAPATNVDEVRAVMSDREIQANIEGGQAAIETLPDVSAESGAVQLKHPSNDGRTISLAAKDSITTREHGDVVETKNPHTGVVSVSQVTEDMGGQVVSILNSPETPYVDFSTDLPNGYALSPEADGTVSIRDTLGQVEGKIGKAWAVDAKGKKLETTYEVLGDGTVRQHIDTTDAAFPIVADPSWWWWTATVAKCAVEIAIAFTPIKIGKVLANLRNLINRSKVVAQAVKALGGLKNAAISFLKYSINTLRKKLGNWGKKLPRYSLTAAQRKHAGKIFSFLGLGLFEFLGFGGCGLLVREIVK
ncbi:hypothetical protein [Stomatohabitans albus]|uniref:hypothetical protein n=1 Tax=Stomatohabitans albus TaxID=3110766 RepID=UPI00300D4D03